MDICSYKLSKIRTFHIGPSDFGVFTGDYQFIYTKTVGNNVVNSFTCNDPMETSALKDVPNFQYSELDLTDDEFVSYVIIYLYLYPEDRVSQLSDNWYIQFQVFNASSKTYNYYDAGNQFGFTNWDYSSNIFSSWKWTNDFPDLLGIGSNMTNGRTSQLGAEWSSTAIEYNGFEELPEGLSTTFTYYVAQNETLMIPIQDPSEKS